MYSGGQLYPNQFWGNGPAPGQFYNFTGGYVDKPSPNTAALEEYTAPGLFGSQHLYTPVTIGTSVVGLRFDQGVMISADNLVSYGSLARFRNIQRVFKINDNTIIGFSGDYADFQSLKRTLDQKIIEDMCFEDSMELRPKALYNWLTRVFYNRRSRITPLWLEIVVGGLEADKKPFLGHVDFRGRSYEDQCVATGFGKHLTLPLMREKMHDGVLTQAAASEVLRTSMEVLYYRDCRALSKYSVAVCSPSGCVVQGPFNVHENWEVASLVKGY